ncbi:uncharacterized protein VICG_00304 [Vittaforma corneae ATCC 50505]|uniref:Origin recognition complex subunit 2 n=1 Tax=Vittaforma corneae (strain ATCC 50505) TaxID=993615 RepID=L2GQE7_VITCO|nr:uncharacterized protein VICG_00304 [Vittaforma corneae ATCC 50505]ELA42552.1 hypothetical protein VICG_00304 [Vittaforma corneae ATCC 50505]
MKSKLLKFHESCAQEYNELLKHFNLLFYGYGCKEKILERLFPKAKRFNMRFSSPKSIAEDLLLQGYGSSPESTINDIDNWLASRGMMLCLVLLNFRVENREFSSLKNIKIIATIESIDIKFELEDLETFNFIFRDLTTFEDYEEDTIDIELLENRVQNVLMVLNNLSAKSKAAFKALLKQGSCTTHTLYDAVKKDLFLTKSASLIDLLKEFVDHKIIKIHENRIIIFLNKQEVKKVLEDPVLAR